MNGNLTRDAFIGLLDFADEPDDDTAGSWAGLDAVGDAVGILLVGTAVVLAVEE